VQHYYPDLEQIALDVEIINAHRAAAYLEKNVCNRQLRPNAVQQYLVDMQNGDWKIGCDCIGFDTEGTLINGQHRLHAIVGTNLEIPFLVARNLPSEAKNTLDVGKKRQLHERITIAGYSISKKEAAITTQLMTHWDAANKIQIETSEMREKVKIIHEYFAPYIEYVVHHAKTGLYSTELAAAVYVGVHLADQERKSKVPLTLARDLVPEFLSLCKHGCRLDGTSDLRDTAVKLYRERKLNAQAKNTRFTGSDGYHLVLSAAFKFCSQVPHKGLTYCKFNPFKSVEDRILTLLSD